MAKSRATKNISSLKAESIKLFFKKDIEREFLDILQWCLFILTRGLPKVFLPELAIPEALTKKISDPVGPGQFVIDRYVANCDAQVANRGAGIPALESVIDFVLNKIDTFDVFEAFKGNKKLEYLQFVV